ncbi:hypothetical protein ACVWW1_009067 [Bradyrhizobium sp. JR3.5]
MTTTSGLRPEPMKPVSKSASSAASPPRPFAASLQSVTRSALIPLMRSIVRKSSSSAATSSSRDPARCVSATKARSALRDEATVEKSGVGVNAALRGSALMRLVSRFQSTGPKYSRSVSLRPAASLIVLSQLSA